MTRRAFQMRHLSRPILAGVETAQGPSTQTSNSLQFNLQEPTWEELLGRR
jgi:hypothetical protein